jgi:hypothetical protein
MSLAIWLLADEVPIGMTAKGALTFALTILALLCLGAWWLRRG